MDFSAFSPVPPEGLIEFDICLNDEAFAPVMEDLEPLDDVKAIAAKILNEPNLMPVGHLPFMERLASCLITGSIEKKVFKCQNGGIVCLDRDPESGDWFIKWALMPTIN